MKDILESYRTRDLKRMLKTNGISGYSKYNKNELIDFMLQQKYRSLFSNLEINTNYIENKKNLAKLQREANKFARQNKKKIAEVENPYIDPPIFTEEQIFKMIKNHKLTISNPIDKIIEIDIEPEVPTLIVDFD